MDNSNTTPTAVTLDGQDLEETVAATDISVVLQKKSGIGANPQNDNDHT